MLGLGLASAALAWQTVEDPESVTGEEELRILGYFIEAKEIPPPPPPASSEPKDPNAKPQYGQIRWSLNELAVDLSKFTLRRTEMRRRHVTLQQPFDHYVTVPAGLTYAAFVSPGPKYQYFPTDLQDLAYSLDYYFRTDATLKEIKASFSCFMQCIDCTQCATANKDTENTIHQRDVAFDDLLRPPPRFSLPIIGEKKTLLDALNRLFDLKIEITLDFREWSGIADKLFNNFFAKRIIPPEQRGVAEAIYLQVSDSNDPMLASKLYDNPLLKLDPKALPNDLDSVKMWHDSVTPFAITARRTNLAEWTRMLTAGGIKKLSAPAKLPEMMSEQERSDAELRRALYAWLPPQVHYWELEVKPGEKIPLWTVDDPKAASAPVDSVPVLGGRTYCALTNKRIPHPPEAQFLLWLRQEYKRQPIKLKQFESLLASVCDGECLDTADVAANFYNSGFRCAADSL